MKKLLVLVCILLISAPAHAWTTVKYSPGGSFAVGVKGDAIRQRSTIVRYGAAGASRYVNSKVAVRPSSLKVVKNGPASSINRTTTIGEPTEIRAGSTLRSSSYAAYKKYQSQQIGGAKPPRVASYCTGITYYKNGTPSCSSVR